MAKLRAYNRQEIPRAVPQVQYYQGNDLYNIGNQFSQFRKAQDNLALNEAAADLRRIAMEENLAKTTNPDAYFGDLDKLKEAKLAEIREGVAMWNEEARAQYQEYVLSGQVPGVSDVNHSTFSNRYLDASKEIAERYGLQGNQLTQFNIAVKDSETEMLFQNGIQRDGVMDMQVFAAAQSTWASQLDTEDYTGAEGTLATLLENGNISHEVYQQMIGTTNAQKDIDTIVNRADSIYTATGSPEEVRKQLTEMINNEELWDGKGLGTKAERKAYLEEHMKDINTRTTDRQRTAAQGTNTMIGDGYDLLDRYRQGEVPVDSVASYLPAIQEEIRKTSTGEYQDPDKKDVGALQNLYDYLLRGITGDDESLSDSDSAVLEYAVRARRKELHDAGYTSQEIVSAIRATPLRTFGINEDGTAEKYLDVVMAAGIYSDPTDAMENFESSLAKSLAGVNGIDRNTKSVISRNAIQAAKALGPDATKAQLDGLLAQVMQTDLTEAIVTAGSIDVKPRVFRNAGMNPPTTTAYGRPVTGNNLRVQNANNNLNENYIEFSNMGLLLERSHIPILQDMAVPFQSVFDTKDGSLIHPQLIADNLITQEGFLEAVTQDDVQFYAAGYGGSGNADSLVLIPTKAVAYDYRKSQVSPNINNIVEVKPLFIATPDPYGAPKGDLRVEALNSENEQYMIVVDQNMDTAEVSSVNIVRRVSSRSDQAWQVMEDLYVGEIEGDQEFFNKYVPPGGLWTDESQETVRRLMMFGETWNEETISKALGLVPRF